MFDLMLAALVSAVLASPVSSPVPAASNPNLVANPCFESQPTSDAGPRDWYIYVPSGTATVRVTDGPAREGRRSLYLETAADIKATVVSRQVAVAPGEKLRLTVWCRTEGLKTSHGGSLSLTAGFLDADKTYFKWHRSQPVSPAEGQWAELATEAVVPPGAAYATLQIGLRMMSGKTWWNDAAMTTASPVAVRFGKLDQEYELGRQSLPVVLLNRDPRLAGTRLRLMPKPAGMIVDRVLTASEESQLAVPFSFTRRGKTALNLALADQASGEPRFSTSANVTVPPLLATEPMLPTHACLEDGPQPIEARVWVHEAAEARRHLSLECRLADPRAKTLAEWHADRLPENPIVYRLAPPSCGPGDYSVRVRLRRGDQVVAEAAEDWHVIRRAQADVRVGPDGYLVVDGKPFFPIGMFNGGRFPEQAAAGFNLTHHYWTMHTLPGQTAPNRGYKEFLDRTEAAGMKALVLVTHGGPKARHLGPEVVRSVRMFRNHPALLAWDEEEGVARGEVPLGFLAELRDLLRREDPHHPLILGDTRAPVQKITDRGRLFPDQLMDLGMWWWYPFPITPAAVDDGLQGTQAAHGMELLPPEFITLAQTQKPLWAGLQAYNKPERKDGRFPTPAEYRLQAYLALISGAKGLMYYVGSGSGGTGILNKPDDGHWEYLKKLVTELRSLEPVILGPDAPEAVTVEPSGAPISVRVKHSCGARRLLLAANRGDQPIEAIFAGAAIPEGPIDVLFENRRLTARTGQLVDRFGPYEVHLYEFRPSK